MSAGISSIEILDRATVTSQPGASHDRLISSEGALILVNKPYGETSFFVVNRIRSAISRASGIRRIKCGHAGTLDPLATGLLIIATRGKTKALANLIGLDKSYLLKMRFGVTSPSFDLELPIELCEGADRLREPEVRSAIISLPGEHEQRPPAFSAIKQGGQPVYKRARRGEDVILPTRVIKIHETEVISIQLPEVSFRVRVSKGTYIRSIVRDLAGSLGTCGILVDLVRESIGPWRVKDSLMLEELLDVFAGTIHHS